MNKSDVSSVTMILVIVITVFALAASAYTTPHQVTTAYKIYYVDAPFGRLYADAEGNWVILGAGSLSTTPSEAYTIKYWSNGELKTLVVDSTDKLTHVLVDDTFSLQVKYTSSVCWPLAGMCKPYDLADRQFLGTQYGHGYGVIEVWIHLPSLPDLTQVSNGGQ